MTIEVNYPCPCCHYLTLTDCPPWTYEICPVCGWEEDGTHLEGQQDIRGANEVTIAEARRNFLVYGAYVESVLDDVREPTPDEIPTTSLNSSDDQNR